MQGTQGAVRTDQASETYTDIEAETHTYKGDVTHVLKDFEVRA